ncbi:GH92 family glycosyl hydrolase [Belliella sp. DSM 111904]|uniref:GH92 family glycosyl hydrolase n=1 Tax=Belliella filtrata TaxID=2923435 RepID=A0ABS9V1Y8_9BACT|nr:GH92 family glycosyl hydrolase [Belliella filtrata]MCH7410433.1 GH92 family glycosyl hydrolase [Belliella filtrata]
MSITKVSILLSFFTLTTAFAQAQEDKLSLIKYVDPFIGTAKMGHTYPGATVPFGSIQLSPDTDTIPYAYEGKYNPDVYRYCAGYQYDDPTIVGFSHTHFSGTGHADLGDLLMMPTVGKLRLNPGTADQPDNGYRSRYAHDEESASPAYYQVLLKDYDINVELTSSTRVGMHKYTFPKTDQGHVILDLKAGIYPFEGKNVWTFIRIENDSTVTGYRQTQGWARTRTVYFALKFSKPFKSYGNEKYDEKQVYRGFWGRFDQSKNFPEIAGKEIRAYFDFEFEENSDPLIAKMAISPVSAAGALANMEAEIPHWDFEQVKREGEALWEQELRKVTVEMDDPDDMYNFYTSMYHASLGPTVYMDADGSYRGLDQNIHQADGFTNYTSFSLWDTYRALHPLFNIIQPERNADMINSMLAHADQSVHGMLPIWSHYANENWCMIGYHAVSVIADAMAKGVKGFDHEKALQASINTSNTNYFDGIGDYVALGYVPEDKSGSSVSKTLEYAYDDWAIAQMATQLKKDSIAQIYNHRSESYKNVYDESIGFTRPKLSDGSFRTSFDPLDTHGQGFIEGNSWNYSLYVPHDPKSLIKMMGGNELFIQRLDSLFTMELPDKYFENTEDITREGIIGNYVHGNEPSHHVVYLYNWTSQPQKSQDKIRNILKTMYQNSPDGLGGNDDFGQMSAWYVFSALGFYPVAPGATEYALGSPLVKTASLPLSNGKTFRVVAKNQGPDRPFVKAVYLNGKELKEPFIDHADITSGGVLEFHMDKKPKKTK